MKLAGAAPAAISITIFIFTLMVESAPQYPRLPLSGSNRYLTQQEQWINQTLDHFSPFGHRQFKQRYYEYLADFRAPNGPIFLRICGEYACNGIVNDYMAVLAKNFGAAVVSLEHRYYGKSSPFKSFTTGNLRYLSSKQALSDLAVFRQYYQDSLNAKLNRSNIDNPWFVFGGSYAGALSAWFRLKFPHLTCGSLASSAVVLDIYNFPEFDQQIGESAGPECKSVLQEITHLVEERLRFQEKAIKKSFGAAELKNNGDFMYYLADAAVFSIIYGNPDKLCIPLIEAKKAGEDLVLELIGIIGSPNPNKRMAAGILCRKEAYATYVKEYYLDDVKSYIREDLKIKNNTERLWWFQICTEFAYFQVAPSNDSIRSSKIDTRYHLDVCKLLFGEGISPDVNATNIYYGGLRIAGSKIIFTNGSQDPWRRASKQTSSTEMPSYLITCHNCGHVTDMRGCPQYPLVPEGDAKNCSSPDAVEKVRQQIIANIHLWISQCHTCAI